MSSSEIRLETIQSMLSAGHRSVCLERHTLLLWGLVGGFLCACTEHILTIERFPDLNQRALALLVWLAFWLGSAALIDYRLTRQVRWSRAETLPFAQSQMTRAWWMLMAMGALGSFAMSFHGGTHMIYGLWTVLLGLGIYLFGLFSRPQTEWIGLATILLGVAGLASGLPFGTTRWLAASCFAIGLPLAGVLGAQIEDTRVFSRILALGFWLAIVAGLPLLISAWPASTPTPNAVSVPLSAVDASSDEQVVAIPRGAVVPLRVDLDSPLLDTTPPASLPLTVNFPIEVSLHRGQPDGRYRLPGGAWRQISDGMLTLRIDRLAPQLEQGQPVIRAHASFRSTEFSEDLP